MSSYLKNIINRHTHSVETVKPRAKSVFETQGNSIVSPPIPNRIETELRPKSHSSITAINSDSPVSNININQPNQSSETPLYPPTKSIASVRNILGNKKGIPELNGPVQQKKKRKKTQHTVNEISKNPVFLKKGKTLQNKLVNPIKPSRSISTNQTGIKTPFSNKQNLKEHQKEGGTLNQIQLINENKVEVLAGNKTVVNPLLPIKNLNVFKSINNNTFPQQVSSNPPPTPTIKIHIGRIEIKAVKPSPKEARKQKAANKPDSSLAQFLEKRTSNNK